MVADVTAVQYRSHDASYRLDIEVVDATELRSRVDSVPDRGFERADFQSFVVVESGTYTHTVDFEVYECRAGSCLVIRPGQVHRFGTRSEWDGWILIAAPQHVPDKVTDLPSHIRLDPPRTATVTELLRRMADDAGSATERGRLNTLLALQTQVLVERLTLGEAAGEGSGLVDPELVRRYRDFRAAVDREFGRWHLVGPYARHLGYSTKSLDRAARSVAGHSAKRVIVERIVLEAKRLLAHGTLPVASISDRLGFDEPTNFVKYFKRETGTTPARFRTQLTADPATWSAMDGSTRPLAATRL